VTREVRELPPGHTFDGKQLKPYFHLKKFPVLNDSPIRIAKELRIILATAVEKYANDGRVGVWLSGGLDSSVMAALARPYSQPFHTFAAGLPDSSDIKFARIVADFLGSEHHEAIVSVEELLAILPEVIYHLESFDARLVRSSLMNFLVGRLSA
jgi:asparagine synthase (glutamine-hydrolysing)